MKSRFLAVVEADGAASASAQCIDDRDGLLVACDARISADAIAEAWRRWGIDCPQHLYSDYAFFIYDRATGESFCARDHIGSRPLFYADDARRFACASDISALLTLPGMSHALDEDLIAASQLERYFDQQECTFYRAIRRLLPGHSLHRTAQGTKIWRWWQPENLPVRDDISDEQAVTETRRLLEAAIEDRLAGAGKVALHLSGGIDSSLVAALVTARTDVDHAYCWQDLPLTNADQPEAEWIEAIRAHLGLSVTAPKLGAEEMADLLARCWTCHPDAGNLLHEAAVQKAAAKAGVTTIFSGWGGDEGISFHGRGHKPWLFATGQWRELWRIAEAPGIRGGLAEFHSAIVRIGRDFLPRSAARRKAAARSLLDPTFARRARRRPEPRIREFGARKTQLQLLQFILSARMEDWAISGADLGVEYVYPLLDRALLEFVVTLPPRMFVRAGGRRWLVREVARGLVPELIRTNVSKDEQARGRQLEQALAEAFRIISRRLDEREEPPAHAHYFDMEKLRTRLTTADLSNSGRDRNLRRAIQLLDLT